MSEPHPNKSAVILDAAAELFAQKLFHEVRLEDISTRARVGKGTVYLYWSSKEEVYLAVIRRGFAEVAARMERELPACRGDCWAEVRAIVDAIVDFAFAYPGVYRIMRAGSMTPEDPELQRIRRSLTERIESVLTRGVISKQLSDPHPSLTTQYLLSFVRGVMLYPPSDLTADMLKSHMLNLLERGIGGEVRP